MPTFFESLSKHALELKNRAVFEAAKLQRVNQLTAEIKALFTRRDQLFLEVGKKAFELAQLGVSVNENMTGPFEQKNALDVQIAMKQEQLTAAKAENWENGAATDFQPEKRDSTEFKTR